MDRGETKPEKTNMEQRIFLVRHGALQTPEKIYLGRTDLPLSTEGWQQAKLLGKCFLENSHRFQRIYTSPLMRCRQTVQGILEGMTCEKSLTDMVRQEPDLMEIDLGEWDGKPVVEVMRLYPEEYEKRGRCLLTYKTPGGESFEQLRNRAVSCFLKIVKNHEDALIVAHAGVNRMILSYCLEQNYKIEKIIDGCLQERFYGHVDFMQIPQEPASCYMITIRHA